MSIAPPPNADLNADSDDDAPLVVTLQTAADVLAVPPPAAAAAPPPRRRQRRRWWVWAVAAAAAVLVVIVAALAMHRRSSAGASVDPSEIVHVKRGTVEKTVESAGKVATNLDVDIKCRANGAVTQLPFDISQHVGKGQLLCQLDPTDEQLSVRLAEASVAQAKAKLEQAKQNLETGRLNLETTRQKVEAALASAKVRAANLASKADRQKELIAQHLGSREEYETAQTDAASAKSDAMAADVAVEELKQQQIQLDYKAQDVATAESQLDTNQISLDQARQELAYTTVTAPIDGTVSALDVQLGSIVASGTGGFSGGTTIMTLSDLSRMFVMATVDESDIGGVRVGQAARIVVDSYPGRTFTGKVVRVPTTGVNSSNVVTFEVKVEVLDDAKSLLKSAMTGTVTIVEDERRDVLYVPSAAVTRQNGKAYVTMAATGAKRAVTLGMAGTDDVEVTSGLAAGDAVVVGTEELPTRWKGDSRGGP